MILLMHCCKCTKTAIGILPWLPLVDDSEGCADWRSSVDANFSFFFPSDASIAVPVGLIDAVFWLR